MRLAKDTHQLDVIGETSEQDFTIKATGKAFRVLIDGLYSNKIESMVRELCSNAWDSHVVAGNADTFFVHCPTELRPEFYVRDYGCGMDDNKVRNLYTTLFDSDKDDTDDLVGAYGLGSKTPFAYADQFFVSCYDGETVRHYSAAIGKNGTPKIILMGSEPCDEPRGVRVGVSVAETDNPAFEKAIRNVSRAYEPVFDSNIATLKKEPLGKLVLTGEGWRAFIDSELPATFNVRQGCVIYPINAANGLTLPTDSGRKYLIDCPIGTIRVTTSRELVEYRPEVVAYLNERLGALVSEAKALVWEEVKDIPHVVPFFTKIAQIKPNFVEATDFIHPASGLSSGEVKLDAPTCLYHASFDTRANRWTYAEQRHITLNRHQTLSYVYEIADISMLFDPPNVVGGVEQPRGDTDLSLSERRRLARLIRAWADHEGIDSLMFAFGVTWSDSFWAACMPNTKRTPLTIAEMRAVIPRRQPSSMARSRRPLLRGLSVVTGKDQTAQVYEIETLPEDSAWMTADLYRRRPSDAWNALSQFGIKSLYIASPTAVKIATNAGIPHLRDAIAARLPEGTGWGDWCELVEKVFTTDESVSQLGARVMRLSPADYDRLAKLKSPLGKAFRLQQPFVARDLHSLSYGTREFLKAVDGDNAHRKTRNLSKTTVAHREAMKLIKANLGSPVMSVLRTLNDTKRCRSPEQMHAGIDGLLAISRAVPLDVQFAND